jgi:TrmH family RNA methyltransferase
MKTIKSKDNNTYKSALKLIKKKYRDETGLYLLEGVKPLEDAIAMGIGIKTIFLCEGTEKPESFPAELCMALDRKLFEALSDTSTSQGMIAVAEKKKYSVKEFSQVASDNGNIVVMDRLQDPGNIGTVIRTAHAAGCGGVELTKGCCDLYNSKIVRATMTGMFSVPVVQNQESHAVIEYFRKKGYKIVAGALTENSASFYDADLSGKVLIIIGNEGNGFARITFISADDISCKCSKYNELFVFVIILFFNKN